jgi:phage baseplate assembly protein W
MAKNNRFSDIDLNFTKNPISGDVNILKDDVAIKRSVKNLVLTSKFERLMQPDIECQIGDRLFENMTPLTEIRIEQAIRHTLSVYEPRIEVIDVIVSGDNDKNYVGITIVFRIQNTSENVTTQLKLERLR